MTSRHPAVSCACPKCQSERRTTPPPAAATEDREAVARALCEKHIRNVRRHDTDATTLEAVLPGAIEMHWFDFQLDADAALSALAPIRAQEIAAARAEEQGYRHTQVAALKHVHAAEILAAEANERARIVAMLRRETLTAARSGGLSPRMILSHTADAIERNEHGAGK